MPSTGLVTHSIYVGAVDASDAPVAYWVVPERCVLEDIYMACGTTLAKHADNYATVTVLNLGQAGGGSTAIAVQDTHDDNTAAVAIAAGVGWQLIKTTTTASLELVAGDVLKATFTETGAATSGDLVQVTLQFRFRPGCGVAYT